MSRSQLYAMSMIKKGRVKGGGPFRTKSEMADPLKKKKKYLARGTENTGELSCATRAGRK